MLESVIEEKEPEKPVDRTKTCPFLLRVFCSNNRHHLLGEYTRGNVPSNELQIYTWKDATLKELTKLIQEVNPETRRRGTFFDFAVVYPDPRMPVFRMKDIGSTCSGQKGADDNVTLGSLRFQIGDYLDIAITLPTHPHYSRLRRGGGANASNSGGRMMGQGWN